MSRNRKSQPKRKPSADDNLLPGQFADLNRQFYGAKQQPYDYLMHRFRSLILAAQSPETLPQAFDTELKVGELKLTWPSDDDWNEDAVRDYLSTESTVLLHHAVEALFRLYFAHADSPECPWLGVARMRQPHQFKNRLDKFLKDDSPEVGESVMQVFYGRKAPHEKDDGTWEDMRRGLLLLLRRLGRRLLDEAFLYNSAKHGLALIPGAASLQFGDQSGPMPIHAEGPSITYLTTKRNEHNERWFQETVWIDPTRTLAVVALAAYQLRNLWLMARWRYLGETPDVSAVHWMGEDFVSQVLDPPFDDSGVRITLPSFSMGLLYDEEPQTGTRPANPRHSAPSTTSGDSRPTPAPLSPWQRPGRPAGGPARPAPE